jgi:hypothetical protein
LNGRMDTEIVKKIRALRESDETAARLFDWLARRTNDVAETSIDRICGMVELERYQAIELVKALAGIGVCEFVVGRKGWKSRVRWHYSVRSLGEAAKGDATGIQEIDPELAEEVADQQQGSDEFLDTKQEMEMGLTLAEAKKGLALTFGVKPESIEIIIKG